MRIDGTGTGVIGGYGTCAEQGADGIGRVRWLGACDCGPTERLLCQYRSPAIFYLNGNDDGFKATALTLVVWLCCK